MNLSFKNGLLMLILFALAGCSSAPLREKETIKEHLDSQVLEVIEKHSQRIPDIMRANHIPGLAVAVVDREGLVWTGGYGKSGLRQNKVTPDTLFSIQSNSKTFAALSILIGVQEGVLDLDAAITSYLPDFRVNSCFETKPQDRITLRNLLNHTAGFAHEAPVGNNIDARCHSFEAHIKSVEDTWLRGKVGEQYFYSNLGIDLAVKVLETVSNESYEQFLKTHIFAPLGMEHTSTDWDTIANSNNIAIGKVSPFVKPDLIPIPMLGAGGVYSSVCDIGALLQFLLNRGKVNDKVVLKESFINEMTTPSATSGTYGLGMDSCHTGTTYRFEHNGMGFGYNSTMMWYPEYGIGCVVQTNSMGSDNQHIRICHELLTDLIGTQLYQTSKVERPQPIPIEYAPYNEKESRDTVALIRNPTYKPESNKYIGSYALIPGGYPLRWYAKTVFSMGYTPAFLKFEVYEKDQQLWIGGQSLSEYEDGQFFTPTGYCLDLRHSKMTWRNMKMKKL